MFNTEENLKLTDLIDIELLQKFQDIFAKAMNVASITVDENGPITKPSNFTDLCIEYTMGSKLGIEKCVICDLKWGKAAAEKNEPIIYSCRAGLTNFAVPIVVEGQHVGTILSGQVFTEQPDEEQYKNIAKEFGIDENNYIDAVKKIKIMPIETVEAAANLLYVFAESISKIGLKNYELIKKSKRANLYKNIMATIRNSLDIKETKQKIVNIIGKTLDADRCFIAEYDNENDKFLIVEDEYLSSSEIRPYKGSNSSEEVPNFAQALKNGKPIIIEDKEFSLETDNKCFDKEKAAIEKFQVNSAFAFPLFYFDQFLGVLSIHYVRKHHKIGEDEINLITSIADQIATAIYHAKLYESEKQVSERELTLRKTIDILRSTLNPEEIKKSFVDIISNYFDTDRCLFLDINKETNEASPFEIEKLKSNEVKSLLGVDPQEAFVEFQQRLKQGKNIIIPDLEKIVTKNKLQDHKSIQKLKESDVKSDYGLSVKYENKVIGMLILHFTTKQRSLNKDEFTFLKILRDEVGIALHQAELFEETKKTAERESLQKTIIATIRSSLDIDETKKRIVNIIGKTLNADRCFIVDYDKQKDEFLTIQNEYLSSDDILSFTGVNLNTEFPVITYAVKRGKNLIVNNKEIDIGENNHNATPERSVIEEYGINSAFAFPIYYSNELLGALAIHYVKSQHSISADEIEFLTTLTNQISIALHQAKLFKITQINTQREKLIGKVLATSISSFDMSQIKTIVNEIGKITKADRCYFIEVDLENMKGKPIAPENEYLASEDIRSAVGYEFGTEDVKEFIDFYLKHKDLGVFDYENLIKNSDEKCSGMCKYSKLFDLKTSIGIPFFYRDKFTAVLAIEYVKEKISPTEDELNFLRILGNQIGMAFSQIQLYQNTKTTAENETTLRQIMLSSVSTFDINQVIKSIVTEAGKLLKADRCFFVEVDLNVGRKGPINPNFEYISSQDIKSVTERQPTMAETNVFIEGIQQNKVVFVEDINKINLPENTMKMLAIELSVKSYSIIPVFYADILYGSIVFHYVNNYKHFTQNDSDMTQAIANQSAIIIHQAELYKQTQDQVKRETFLREIISIIRSSIDLDKIKYEIVNQVGKHLNADRVFFADYDPINQKYLISPSGEYISSDKFQSLKEFDFTSVPGFIENIRSQHLQGRDVVFEDIDEFAEGKDENGKKLAEFFKSQGFISLFAVNMNYYDQYLGNLVISFNNKRFISNEDIYFIKTIADQSSAAVHQAQLYKLTIEQAEREALLRNITENIRRSLNIEETLSFICEETAKLFNVQRSAIVYMPDLKRSEEFVMKKEYKSSNKIQGFLDGEDVLKAADFWSALFQEGGQTFAFDNIEESNASEGFKNTYKSIGVKSIIGTAIKKGEELWGNLVLSEYNNYRHWSDEDKNLLSAIADQVYIAINQANLFEKEKQAVQREVLLRDITEKIRSSLDIEETLSYICEETAKLFNVQRSAVTSYPVLGDYEIFIVRKEYKSTSEIKGYEFNPDYKKAAAFWGLNLIGENKVIALDNITESDTSDDFKEIYSSLGIKSIIGTAIKKGEDTLGTLVLSEYNNYRHWSEEEKALLNAIADQVYLAINQAELFAQEKKTAQREALLRHIFETMRSSIEVDVVKREIVSQVGELFKADRVAFADYDSAAGNYYILEGNEYKSNPNVKSFIGHDFASIPGFIESIRQIHLIGKDIIFSDLDEYLEKNNLKETGIENFYREFGFMSSMAINMTHGEDFYGNLVVTFEEKRKIGEDEIEFLKTIANQAGIALHQAKLYEELKQTTSKQNAILNNMPFMAWLKDKNSTLLAINDEFARMCSTSKENIIGKTDFDFFPKEYAELYVQEDKAVMKTRQMISSVDLISGPNGTSWQETFKSPVIDTKGEVIGSVGISRDITEMKQLETAIIENKNLLKAILDSLPYWTWLKDRESRYILVNKTYANDQNLSIENFIGKIDTDVFPKEIAEGYIRDDQNIIETRELKIFEEKTVINGEIRDLETIKQPFFNNKGEVIGTVGVAKDITERKQAELELLRRQEKIIKANAREVLLRKILDTMRSSLDVNTIKNKIVTEIGSALNADICFVMIYVPDKDYYYVDKYSEYRSSENEGSYIGADSNDRKFKWFIDAFRNNQEVDFTNSEEFLAKNNLYNQPEESYIRGYNLKSGYSVPIYYLNTLLGYIHVQFTNNYRVLDEDDLAFVRIIATQAGIAIHQAELYNITQVQAEREKISRNIVEILRSTLDKNTIKHLFVREIGKYFKADRVFFADYDSENKMYLPVDKNSEYLSSSEEKSFVGYNWSESQNYEYIQPLLEKRELNIYSWDEYISKNPKSQDFINRFVNSNIKSSYNLPVLYQEQIIGYFCIEFTHEENRLSSEDINRIRNMCTQAGIALYHADLLTKAQETASSNIECISLISNELDIPLDDVIKFSEKAAVADFEKTHLADYFSLIKNSGQQLSDIKSNITTMAKIKSPKFKLTIENINSKELFVNTVQQAQLLADKKSIKIETDFTEAHVYADKEMLPKVLYNILSNLVKLLPDSESINIKSELKEEELIATIEGTETNLDYAAKSFIIDKFKNIDTSKPINKQAAGIGLSIARRIIELHKGIIQVEFIEEKKIQIIFVLPKARG